MEKSPAIAPCPLFDTLENVQDQYRQCQSGDARAIINVWLKDCFSHLKTKLPEHATKDYQQILNFLYSYRGSLDTFNAYRRELERLFQWGLHIYSKSILNLKRADIEIFLEFCQNPDDNWVGTKTVARFIQQNGAHKPNPAWRPFVVKIAKKSFQMGKRPEKSHFKLSREGMKQIFAILSSFYNYLIQEEVTETNPLLQIRQKSKFIQKQQQSPTIRRLSEIQWKTVIKAATLMAEQNPIQHERTLFMMHALYGMYLRISELAASSRWTPMMRDFFRDSHGDWWFKTVGKGNKMRQIAVSFAMLDALKRWRQHLNLSSLPTPDEEIFLL